MTNPRKIRWFISIAVICFVIMMIDVHQMISNIAALIFALMIIFTHRDRLRQRQVCRTCLEKERKYVPSINEIDQKH